MLSWVFSQFNSEAKILLKLFAKHIDKLLVMAFAFLFIFHFESLQEFTSKLIPTKVYTFNLTMSYQSNDSDISIRTYIPEENERQSILSEQIINNGLDYLVTNDLSGKKANWSGYSASQQLAFRYLLSLQAIKYQISPELTIPAQYPSELSSYLAETDAIQVSHPEIKILWKLIAPKDKNNLLAVLSAIYQHTYQQIKPAPFKGVTDAVTTLRLKTASCNGKSRLFIALARLNNIPARLVGGVILNGIDKKTSHQWLEIYAQNQWIPFGPTNGNFGQLPANYLELYRGDENLFRHTVDINFDYQFSSQQNLVAPAVYNHQEIGSENNIDITGLLLSMGLDPKTIGLFLLFPICTLLITFLRNLVGIKTFGIFLPMLISAACVFIGYAKGVGGFAFILLTSFIAYHFLDKLKLLKVPRLAAIITINTIIFVLGLLFVGASNRLEFGMLSLFPVIIISFIAEKIHRITEEGDWQELLNRIVGTMISITGCYWLLASFMLQGLFSYYPESFLLVLAGQIYIGKWTGIRISEMFRFRDILTNADYPVIGINSRNKDFIYQLNDKGLLDLAADKLGSKARLKEFNIPVPETICYVNKLIEIDKITPAILRADGFALKPNQGSQGNGIEIITRYCDGVFYGTSNKEFTLQDIKRHCHEILAGSYSQSGDEDVAYFEPLIQQSSSLQIMSPFGLCDIRVVLSKGKVISAMLRMPTKKSSGKANLHQGAIGIGIDIKTGITQTAKSNKKNIVKHPDSLQNLIGFEIPFWEKIISISQSCQKAIPLGYIGVDICLDSQRGPLVLEVNGRPGIEIQNIQERGFYYELSQ